MAMLVLGRVPLDGLPGLLETFIFTRYLGAGGTHPQRLKKPWSRCGETLDFQVWTGLEGDGVGRGALTVRSPEMWAFIKAIFENKIETREPGPLPVTSRVIIPLTRVITSVTHL